MMMGMVATMCQLRNAWSEARDKQAEAMGVVQNAKLLAAQAALAEAEAAQERLEVGHPSPPLSSLLAPHPVCCCGCGCSRRVCVCVCVCVCVWWQSWTLARWLFVFCVWG
jgi:hypothetical protein